MDRWASHAGGASDRIGTDEDRPARRSAEVDHAKSSGWAWRWTGWASWPISPAVLWVCAVAVVVDVGTSWWGHPEWYLGRVSMSPALPLGVLLVALVGPRNLGFSKRSFAAWREFLILGGPVLLVWCISYPQSVAEFRDIEGIVVAVAGEELVYRLAAVILIGALCARIAGRNWRDTAQWGTGPAIGGLVGAGLVFSSLPGHVQQMDGAANVLPFLSLAVLLGYTALRSGSIIPGLPRAPHHRPRRARLLRRRAAEHVAGRGRRRRADRSRARAHAGRSTPGDAAPHAACDRPARADGHPCHQLNPTR